MADWKTRQDIGKRCGSHCKLLHGISWELKMTAPVLDPDMPLEEFKQFPQIRWLYTRQLFIWHLIYIVKQQLPGSKFSIVDVFDDIACAGLVPSERDNGVSRSRVVNKRGGRCFLGVVVLSWLVSCGMVLGCRSYSWMWKLCWKASDGLVN